MGVIRKLKQNELLGGNLDEDVYPITSTKAVYNGDNISIDNILKMEGIYNISLDYNSTTPNVLTKEQAIAKIPQDRKAIGFIGKFLSNKGWELLYFNGNQLSQWDDISKWSTSTKIDVINSTGENTTLPISQYATTLAIASIFPFVLEKGGIDVNYDVTSEGEFINTTIELSKSNTKVRSKTPISGSIVKSITVKPIENLFVTLYALSREGKYIIGNSISSGIINLETDKMYIIQILNTKSESLSVESAYKSIDIKYREYNTKDDVFTNVINVENLTPFFIKGAYYSIAESNPKYKAGQEIYSKNSNILPYACISLKLKRGDFLFANNIVTDSSNIRPYGLFRLDGTPIFIAHSSYSITEETELRAEEDCYLVINTKIDSGFTLRGKFTLHSNDRENYITPLLQSVGEIENKVNKITKPIRVLFLGDTSMKHAINHVPFLLRSLISESNFTIGVAYGNDYTLVHHTASLLRIPQNSGTENINPVKYNLSISMGGKPWVNSTDNFITSILDMGWDLIVLGQGVSIASSTSTTYYTINTPKLMSALFSKIRYNFKIGWYIPHSAKFSNKQQSTDLFKLIINNYNTIINMYNGIIFPCGTTIQNLRTTFLGSLGDFAGNGLLSTPEYLQEGIACLATGYTIVLALAKAMGYSYKGILGDRFNIDNPYINNMNITDSPQGTTGILGLTDDNRYRVQIASEIAIRTPKTESNITYI